jgi:hypothetical protein
MIAATGAEGDGRYTAKSALYQAAFTALYSSPAGGGSDTLCGICCGGSNEDEFSDWVGGNWAMAGDFVLSRLPPVIAADGYAIEAV